MRTTLSTESCCGRYSHASAYQRRCLRSFASFTTACGLAYELMTASTQYGLMSRTSFDKAACCRCYCSTCSSLLLRYTSVRFNEAEDIVRDLVYLEEDAVFRQRGVISMCVEGGVGHAVRR